MKIFLTGLAIFALSMTTYAQKQQKMTTAKPYEVYYKGKVAKGYGVHYKGGKVQLLISDGGSAFTKFDIGQVSKIKSPKPKILKDVMLRINRGKFSDVVKVMSSGKGQELYVQNYYLGWGKRLAFGYCYALIKEGKASEALSLLKRARGFVHSEENVLDDQLLAICFAAIDLAENKKAAAVTKLKKQMSTLLDEAKPYLYNLLGDLESDNQLAVLSYYKTLLLDKTCVWQRYYARKRIMSIYDSQNDLRSKQLTKFK
jgi:hypothetical protein